jgi:hypothetical protein
MQEYSMSFSRRNILGAGFASLATAIATTQVNAQTRSAQSAASPDTNANRKGIFASKVVLITGATPGIS